MRCLTCNKEIRKPNKLQRTLTMANVEVKMWVECCPKCGEYLANSKVKNETGNKI